jgi:hypothetical protein
MNTFFVILITIGAMWFAYMSSHIVDEQKRGKQIPLPWEKD